MTTPLRRGQDRVWDKGLQPERTSLAWQRVNLAGLGASMVSARLLLESNPLLGYGVALLSGGMAAMLVIVHGRRFGRVTAALFAGRSLPDGLVYLIPVTLLLIVGAGGLTFALFG
jgi:uncharacterized membrane protein YidH (DUF202 family)